jgi:N-methylhydantoinase B
MTSKVNDPITLEIIQNSLQATADEMFAVMKKTAMSSIIYEVLDMGTGITDAKGALASSGAGIPAFIGVLDKAVKVIVEIRQAGRHRAGRRLRHQRSLLWRRHPPERHRRHDAGLRRRAHHRLDRQHRPQFRRRRHGARLACPAMRPRFPGRPAPAGHQDHLQGRADPLGDGHHQGQLAHAGRARRRRLGGDRLGAHRRRRLVEIAEKYGVDTFENAMASFMDHGEQVSLQGTGETAEGHLRTVRGAGRRPHLQRQDHHLRHRVRGRPARQSRSVDQPGQHQPRRRHGLGADDLQVADRSLFAGQRGLVPADQAADPSRLGVRGEGAGADRLLLRDRAARVRHHVALPGAAHARPAGGRPFRLGVRHLHRRHPSRYRPPIHHHRAADRRLGRSRTGDGNSAIFCGFHGETYNCPPRSTRRATASMSTAWS